MRRPLVAGNWKMHGSREGSRALVGAILEGLDPGMSAEAAVCPPFVYLADVREALGRAPVALGAQDLCPVPGEGAHTGEVSGRMLAEFGCRYVIVGHSERRSLYGEDDATVARKFLAAREAGLCPILCVGERLEEREAGITEQVVARQLDAVLESEGGLEGLREAVIAYEPVWAIGTGRTAAPAQAQEVHAFIRARVAGQDPGLAAGLRILYGGSVKPDNAAELFTQPDVDGGLIGGASLKADSFLAICRAAD